MQLFCMKLYILCIFYNNEIKVSRQHWGPLFISSSTGCPNGSFSNPSNKGAFKQNQASPVQGEVGFAQQNSEGLLHKILQNDGKTIPQSLCRSPLCWGSQTKLQQPPLCKRRWHTVRCDGGIVPVIILNDLQIDRFATLQSLSRQLPLLGEPFKS